MILVLNGPNLNRLGKREPHIYGTTTLDELETKCESWASELGTTAVCHQSNFEGQLIEWLHRAEDEGFKAVIFNAGAYTHTSVALRDAIKSISIPVIEIHISNIHTREEFRHHSYIAPVCQGSIVGLGILGYKMALQFLVESLRL
ncbi:MAG: type II 3-dehydroquinate dehydratase [Deinococcales bacterium]